MLLEAYERTVTCFGVPPIFPQMLTFINHYTYSNLRQLNILQLHPSSNKYTPQSSLEKPHFLRISTDSSNKKKSQKVGGDTNSFRGIISKFSLSQTLPSGAVQTALVSCSGVKMALHATTAADFKMHRTLIYVWIGAFVMN